jgi:hypothetical protein
MLNVLNRIVVTTEEKVTVRAISWGKLSACGPKRLKWNIKKH